MRGAGRGLRAASTAGGEKRHYGEDGHEGEPQLARGDGRESRGGSGHAYMMIPQGVLQQRPWSLCDRCLVETVSNPFEQLACCRCDRVRYGWAWCARTACRFPAECRRR
jgi:hypothetical protein